MNHLFVINNPPTSVDRVIIILLRPWIGRSSITLCATDGFGWGQLQKKPQSDKEYSHIVKGARQQVQR
jgi:hypothetical protein